MSWFSSILGNILPGVFSGGLNYFGQSSANQANRDIARETNQTNRDIANATNAANAKQVADLMKWQETMSNSAYQRSVKDMEAAGINPMLAANLGGSSTPPGASIPNQVGSGAVTGAPMQNEYAGVGPAVHSAMDAMRLKYEVQNMQEQAKNLRETNKKISSDTALNSALIKSATEDAKLKSNSARVAAINAENMKLDQIGRSVEAAIDKSKYGTALRYMGRLNPLSSITGPAKEIATIVR